MNKIKFLMLVCLFTLLFSYGQPATKADTVNAAPVPPAVVFVQDKENPMLVNHNFIYDNGMLKPAGDSEIDSGIYITLPK